MTSSLENGLNKKFTIWTFSVACFLAMLDVLCLRVLSGIKLVYGQISQEIMGFTNTCMKNSFCKLYMRRIFLLWMNETPTLFFSVFFIRIFLEVLFTMHWGKRYLKYKWVLPFCILYTRWNQKFNFLYHLQMKRATEKNNKLWSS